MPRESNYGSNRRSNRGRWAAFFVLLFAATFLSPPLAYTAPASDTTGTLLSWNHGQLQLQGGDGRAFQIKITPATWVLRRGQPAGMRDFAPGETLQVRLGRGTGGTMRALLVCDPETAEALATQRGHLLVGTLLSAEKKFWIIQSDDGSVPLLVCLSSHTTFRAGQASVPSGAFSPGIRVTVQTRFLPNGLPSAVAVTDGTASDTDGAKEKRLRPRKTFSGAVVEARLDLGWLTLQNKSGVSQIVVVDSQTSIRVRTGKILRSGTWDDLTVGQHVFARFAGTIDTEGHPLAVSLSVSGP